MTCDLLQSKTEKEQKKRLEDVIRLLMMNILPQHVASYYIQHGQDSTV